MIIYRRRSFYAITIDKIEYKIGKLIKERIVWDQFLTKSLITGVEYYAMGSFCLSSKGNIYYQNLLLKRYAIISKLQEYLVARAWFRNLIYFFINFKSK